MQEGPACQKNAANGGACGLIGEAPDLVARKIVQGEFIFAADALVFLLRRGEAFGAVSSFLMSRIALRSVRFMELM